MSTPKSIVRSIGNEIAALPQVKELLKKYGLVSVTYAGGTIKHDSFSVRIEFTNEVQGNDRPYEARPASGQSKFAQHGLPEDIIGKPIRLGGRPFTIVDVKPQNAQGSLKKCVVIEGSGGGRYITTAADVKRALGIAQTPGTLIKRDLNELLAQDEQKQDMAPGIKAKFEALASQLSPENLHMDGEISKSQAAGRKGAIMSQWRALEKLAGRKVATSEFGV